MKTLVRVLGACALIGVAAVSVSAQQVQREGVEKQLAAVKLLYASAAYEDALAHLEAVPVAESTAEVEQLRALCFLALNRTSEAERALEQLIRRAPLYRMTDADVSPRLVAMFADVRKRVLPLAAKELYARGRWSYQGADFEAAAADLRQLLALLALPELSSAPREVLDLKLLAEGFLNLAEADLAQRPAGSVPPSPSPLLHPQSSAPGANPVRPGNGSAPSRIYDGDDSDVKAPIELSRQMPPWSPPANFTEREFRGALEVVIDELGNVVSAVSLGSIMPNYDEILRAAARRWKYRPAMLRDGTPVRYRVLIGYLLKPVFP